ncbi:unnamed protein product [Paramecium pentaurelia]|uniref:Uncharacterized protein n=1 Tax=Paramecium pentaurelia TaxID=43138 RepID=A0A8S1XD61_9CILI|nr:unnamed protein product [Paramecium pentaurelia]
MEQAICCCNFLDPSLKYIHDTTIGIEFVSQEIKVSDQNITICISETPGKLQSRFLTHIFYRVYDAFLVFL